MLFFEVHNLIFHRIGVESDMSFLSTSEYDVHGDDEEDVLKKIFLKPFANNVTTYEFKHDIDLELNTLFKLSRDVYKEENFILKLNKFP